MKKKFKEPKLQVKRFETMDVIATSTLQSKHANTATVIVNTISTSNNWTVE